ncbi:MAG: GIY-YIG nuclease family protein [Candidatus Omnitrophica bacterium]|nr:GIY-YIG nuclease family protein [Candidatus Omnitrophota bacterium]
MNIYWVYVLKNRKDNEPYYGYTNNLERRLKEHDVEKVWKFVGCEGYTSELDARERESKLKHYGQTRTYLKKRLRRSFEL